jgi:hypothetical protein
MPNTSTLPRLAKSDPIGDERFFSLSRQPKCIPIVATQSISSLKSSLPGDSWRTLFPNDPSSKAKRPAGP